MITTHQNIYAAQSAVWFVLAVSHLLQMAHVHMSCSLNMTANLMQMEFLLLTWSGCSHICYWLTVRHAAVSSLLASCDLKVTVEHSCTVVPDICVVTGVTYCRSCAISLLDQEGVADVSKLIAEATIQPVARLCLLPRHSSCSSWCWCLYCRLWTKQAAKLPPCSRPIS